jgi:hypothetical protein
MRIAILGAYGNAGRAVARLLRLHADDDLLLLGRHPTRAELETEKLKSLEGGGSVSWAAVDARNADRLRKVLDGCDVMVVAASTVPQTAELADAAMDAGCDWLDLNLAAASKHTALRVRETRMKEAGRCFVTDGGVHPGAPGALVRYAAARMPLRRAWVAARFDLDWASLRFSRPTVEEFLDELSAAELRLLREGLWVRGYRYARTFDFGAPLGRALCVPMHLPELLEVRDAHPELEGLGFFVAGMGPVVDWLVMPVTVLGSRVFPFARNAFADFLGWGLATFADAGRGAAVLLRAEGPEGESLDLRLFHEDAYVLTAAPVVATLLQWSEARAPGLHTQAMFVDAERFVADLPLLGIATS